ncbi:transposase [Chloroflexota bacterium]
MNKPAKAIELSDKDRRVLQSWVRAHSTPQQIVRRGVIILRASEGMANSRIAEEASVSRTAVIEWRKRFLNEGLAALTQIKPGRGRKPQFGIQRVEDIVKTTLNSLPPGATVPFCLDG